MRKSARVLLTTLLFSALVTLIGCVTINVYFPEAAAQKAADQFIGTVLDNAAPAASDTPSKPTKPTKPQGQPSAMLLDLLIPAAVAADAPNLRVQTASTTLIQQRMQARFRKSMAASFDAGALGFTHDGMVALRDASKVPLSDRAEINAALGDENNDRAELYREVAAANGHPEWEPQVRAAFAQGWIERARAGWYYQDASGQWQRK